MLNSAGENKILENSRDVPEKSPDYPWSGPNDSSENAGGGEENCWNGQRTVDLKAGLCRAWDVTQRFNPVKVFASTDKKLQVFVFLLLFSFLVSNANKEGQHQEHAVKCQICPKLPRFVR